MIGLTKKSGSLNKSYKIIIFSSLACGAKSNAVLVVSAYI
jgi:hypothetical protein